MHLDGGMVLGGEREGGVGRFERMRDADERSHGGGKGFYEGWRVWRFAVMWCVRMLENG